MASYDDLRAELVTRRDALERRMTKIRSDRRGISAPPERDSQEQAVQRENDEVLDALNEAGRDELASIHAAIARIDLGSYGLCERCGEGIGEGRLRALPTALLCLTCSE